jgi:hypothetical protein
MEEFKSWEEMTVLEQMACQYWDMYKDAHGIRPRGIDTSTWTEADFIKEFEYLGQVITQQEEARVEAEHLASVKFEQRVLILMGMGADDRATAVRWIHEAEGTSGDDEYLCWTLGLPYSYFRRELA